MVEARYLIQEDLCSTRALLQNSSPAYNPQRHPSPGRIMLVRLMSHMRSQDAFKSLTNPASRSCELHLKAAISPA